MSFSTEPTAKTDPTGNPANGFTPPAHSVTGKVASPKVLPSRGRSGGKIIPLAIAGVLLLGASATGGWWFFLRTPPARADVLLHTVKREQLVVSVTEKGTLESADNRDIVCRVRAGAKGFASTINWVIDDGSRVKKGQLLMILDDSALKDQEEDQQIKVQTALAAKVTAERAYDIQVTLNKENIVTAEAALTNAINALKDYTGLSYDSTRAPLAALGGGPLSLSEAGTFRQKLDDLTGQMKLAQSEVEQNRDRAGWADRMVKLSYMSSAQAQSEKSRLDSSVEKLRSLQAQRTQLITSSRDQDLTKLVLDRDLTQIKLERATLEAESKLVQLEAEKKKATSIYAQEEDKLHDIGQQRAECRITAPDDIADDSMVVYFKPDAGRFNNSSQGLIEQGAQVKEGQKMLRIPNLHRMQVNTKVHEAMVARIRGDVRIPTHSIDAVQVAMCLTPYLRPIAESLDSFGKVRDKLHQMGVREYKTTAEGQKAMIRVDALAGRQFGGHVRTVATIASQDAWAPDVKLYQTIVMVDYELLPGGEKKALKDFTTEELKPDMTAEVTITVDTAKEAVLTVPVQAIVGGSDLGGKREIFVKTDTGYDRREVKLGLYNEKIAEVREGLTEGDEVVLNPKVLLAPDDKTKTRDDGGKGGGNKGGGGGDGAAPKGDGKGAGGGKGGNKKGVAAP